jgi:hypothetical protein
METHFSTRVEPALAARDASTYDAVLVLDELRGGVFGVAPGPARIGGLAAGVRDADLLRSETVRILAEGEYFRLSALSRGQFRRIADPIPSAEARVTVLAGAAARAERAASAEAFDEKKIRARVNQRRVQEGTAIARDRQAPAHVASIER